MTKIGIEYLKFYNRIGGRINKKGNFVPFKPRLEEQSGHRARDNYKIIGAMKNITKMNHIILNYTGEGGLWKKMKKN